MVFFIKSILIGPMENENGNRKSDMSNPVQNKLSTQAELMLRNIRQNLKKNVEDRICFETVSVDQKKIDRRRIIDKYENKLLDLISDNEFAAFIFEPMTHGYKDFNDFKNLYELTKIEYQKDEMRQKQHQKDSSQV